MRKKSVLIVDDDQLLLDGLKRVMRPHPFYIVAVNSADEAMDEMRMRTFDAIVSDNWMKGMNGSKLMVWVKKYYPDTARIVLTGQPNLISAETTDAKVFRVLGKPVTDEQLANCIIDACNAIEPKMKDARAPVAWPYSQPTGEQLQSDLD